MKLTDWIPGKVKPVRVGVYQREYDSGDVQYSYWNGKFWGLYGVTPKEAELDRSFSSRAQTLPWRGLAEKPE